MPDTGLQKLQNNLSEKKILVGKILEVVNSQAELLESSELNVSVFDASMDELGQYAEQIEKLDTEMTDIAQAIDKSCITSEDKEKLSHLSKEIEKLAGQVQVLLDANRSVVDDYIGSQHRDVASQRKSVAGIRGYFKSMGGLSGNSTYMDDKI